MRERNFGFIYWVTVFVSLSICSCICEEGKNRQTYVIRYKDGEQTIPVTVVLDYKKQTEYVINMNPRTPAKSVTLYDFKQRTIAYKDLTNNECFLGRLTHETLNEESNALQDVKNPVEVRPKVRSLDPRKPALTPTEIRNIAGQKAAVFCRKMNTWLLVPEKTHSISKREADEYEDRTYQYHGHRSSQYSHYERETRRRYRNRSHSNSRPRSQRKESEAKNGNARLGIPAPSPLLPHLNIHSPNGIQYNPSYPDNIHGAALQNHSFNDRAIPYPPYFDQVNGRESLANRMPFRSSNINLDAKYPSTETKPLSSDEIPFYSRNVLRDSGLNETDGSLDTEFLPDPSRNITKQSSSLIKLSSDDDTSKINERTTTASPSIPFGQAGYPNVHSSLVHLLPLYKPLSQEFDLDQTAESNSENHQTNQQKGIESEDHLFPRALVEPDNSLNHFKFVQNVSHDPDVSINVLEVPRITKEFENMKDNESEFLLPQSEKSKLHGSLENHPLRKHPGSSPYFQKNDHEKKSAEYVPVNNNEDNFATETYFEKKFHVPHSEVTTLTRLPVLSTQKYSAVERTTPVPAYIPSVHTAFQNSEDFNTFQIFPNFIDNPASTERSFSAHATAGRRDENNGTPQSLILTTDYPLTVPKHRVDTNHRTGISNEDTNAQSPSFNPAETDIRRSSYTPIPNNTINVDVPSYKVRYQSVLRDFKPDEIVIDIENIPTHTPPPVTARFHQRLLTTIQPTVKSLSSSDVKSETDQRKEQVSGAAWRSAYPTTRYPRRRIGDKPRRPTQNSSISFAQRNLFTPNRHHDPKPPARINQLHGVSSLNSAHHTNRRQFHYPSPPIPSSRVIMRTETNQLHHVNHLNNLPPGVSVHPRHPQAPFADMVRSNRPPTMPFVNDDRVFTKPHHQRHHRKKESHNSCCRLRGQMGALQSCCRNGGSCCSRSRRRMQPQTSHCCSSSSSIGQVPPKQIQPPVRITNQTLPPIRTEKNHRSEVDNTDRCQKEKMCRTLYESTQQVMVCRNAHIEGC